MAVFVPYVQEAEAPELCRRLYGWRTSFDTLTDALGAPREVVVAEFPATPEGGFPIWINLDRKVNFKVASQ